MKINISASESFNCITHSPNWFCVEKKELIDIVESALRLKGTLISVIFGLSVMMLVIKLYMFCKEKQRGLEELGDIATYFGLSVMSGLLLFGYGMR